jgi:NADH:ubiquinone oxidoreductase subunit 5 (subunit L)/multisubunit Na+/H+ antiporter MnhA subunit
MGSTLLLCAIFIPVLGSFLLPLAGRASEKLRNALALIFVSASFLASLSLLPGVLRGETVMVSVSLPLGFGFGFMADGLAVFMALVSSFVAGVIVFYSLTYISHYQNRNEYYLMVVLFIGAMMGLVYSTNLLFMYLFWEISAVACWRLIGFFREKEYVLRADKALLMTVFGALMMLLGFIVIYTQYGTFDMIALKSKSIPNVAVILILFGILSKSATLPLHTWLPDAGVAPSPVTSLLHAAVLVKIGVYAFARLFLVTFTVDPVWHTVVPIIVAASALVSAGAAIVETDIKRIIAYSTVSQLAFIFLGLSTNSALGIAGGLLYIMMHSLAKGGLFLCAGIVEQNTHTKDVRKMGGLIKTMPVTAVAFLICAFSVMGLPPLGGFFAKYMVIGGAVNAGQPWIAAVFILGAVMTVIYLLRVFTLVFMGAPKGELAKEGSKPMVASVITLAGLSILGGILIAFPSGFAQQIVNGMAVMFK